VKKNIKKKIYNNSINQKQINTKQVKKKKNKKKKIKIKFKFIFFLILLICLIVLGIYYISGIKITNIYISGNDYLKDQEIIELANIQDYPPVLKNSSFELEKKLKDNIYIKDAKVTKKKFTQVFITIEENRPLFYNLLTMKTVLLDNQITIDRFNIPVLINNIPDRMYQDFINKMAEIDVDILNKISEIKYIPDEVDDERFLLSMTDYNYVYLTLNKFESINNYNDIIKQFDNKKGILYLNSGGYFEIK